MEAKAHYLVFFESFWLGYVLIYNQDLKPSGVKIYTETARIINQPSFK